jgi:hypothetical protein
MSSSLHLNFGISLSIKQENNVACSEFDLGVEERGEEEERKGGGQRKKQNYPPSRILHFIYLFAILEFELRVYTLSHSTSPLF